MTAMSAALYTEVTAALRQAGRQDLADQLAAFLPKESLTSSQAAELLGISSANTVKNWLMGGHFPGAYRTRGGHWRFPRAEVEAVKRDMEQLSDRNKRGDLTVPDVDAGPPPFL